MAENIYGYFDDPDQEKPAYDPGFGVRCPICGIKLQPDWEYRPMVTISVMLESDARSYFYRVHKACYVTLNAEMREHLDGIIMGAIAQGKNVN